jgi:hypothetical protein
LRAWCVGVVRLPRQAATGVGPDNLQCGDVAVDRFNGSEIGLVDYFEHRHGRAFCQLGRGLSRSELAMFADNNLSDDIQERGASVGRKSGLTTSG